MTMLTTPDQIRAAGVIQLYVRLKLEVKGMTCRPPSAYSQVKEKFGFKGSKVKVLEQLGAWLDKNPPYPGYVRKP